ncbi:MAG: hypothetical protein GY822_32510 [Deltaproteobacteria bacterium]|nr:hypothetical protein [Deltaproteobacteria bacterium]
MSVLRRHGYVNIPGSASLKTQKRSEQGDIAEVEAIDMGSPFAREVRGEWLANTLVRASFVAIPDDVFDRLLPTQAPLEQVLYLHLLRLCLAKERNFCRASRRELAERCQLSDRRLGAALAGLVDKDHIRLVDRNRKGTLYRVCFPHEVFGESAPASLHMHFIRSPSAVKTESATTSPEPPKKARLESNAQNSAREKPDTDDEKTSPGTSQQTTASIVDGVENRRTLATATPLVSFAKAAKAAAAQTKTLQEERSSSSDANALAGSTLASTKKHTSNQKVSNKRAPSASTRALLGRPATHAPQKSNASAPPVVTFSEEPTSTPRGLDEPTAFAVPKNDSPGSIATWFIDTYGEGKGRSKSELIEAIFDRLETGHPFTTIRDELTRFGQENPGVAVAHLERFLNTKEI